MNQNAGLLARLRQGLSRTRAALTGRLERALAEAAGSEDEWDALEELLLGADFGVQATQRLLETVRDSYRAGNGDGAALLRRELANLLKETGGMGARRYSESPWVVLVVGVNGVGKTTTIGKLAHRLGRGGRKVLLAAGDTFRAGAIEQLEIWGKPGGGGGHQARAGTGPFGGRV